MGVHILTYRPPNVGIVPSTLKPPKKGVINGRPPALRSAAGNSMRCFAQRTGCGTIKSLTRTHVNVRKWDHLFVKERLPRDRAIHFHVLVFVRVQFAVRRLNHRLSTVWVDLHVDHPHVRSLTASRNPALPRGFQEPKRPELSEEYLQHLEHPALFFRVDFTKKDASEVGFSASEGGCRCAVKPARGDLLSAPCWFAPFGHSCL